MRHLIVIIEEGDGLLIAKSVCLHQSFMVADLPLIFLILIGLAPRHCSSAKPFDPVLAVALEFVGFSARSSALVDIEIVDLSCANLFDSALSCAVEFVGFSDRSSALVTVCGLSLWYYQRLLFWTAVYDYLMADSRRLSVADRMERATQDIAITDARTSFLEERSRSDPGCDTLSMDLLSPPSIMPHPVISSMDGVMTNQSDFASLRHQVAAELSAVQKYVQGVQNDQSSLNTQANQLVRELQTSMSAVLEQQRSLCMAVGSSQSHLKSLSHEHRSLSDGLIHLDASHRQVKHEHALYHDEVNQAFDAQYQQSSRLKQDFCAAQSKNENTHQQIIQQMRKDTNQAYQAYVLLRDKLDASTFEYPSSTQQQSAPQQPMDGVLFTDLQQPRVASDSRNLRNLSSLPIDSHETTGERRNSTGSGVIHAPVRRPPRFHIDRFVRWEEEIILCVSV